jgi:sugar phosphate isomerase/epimerase
VKRFGLSTHLYHEDRLERRHLVDIAAHQFDAVEVFATRSHFDYHDTATIAALQEWLKDANLELHSIHAPITDVFANGQMQRTFSIATRDAEARAAALHEMSAALHVARVIPFRYLVVHLGVPQSLHPGSEENNRDAAVRSVEDIITMAEPLGVTVALEVMGNALSTPAALVDIIERSFDGADVGICMDVGHAHMMGDTPEAIETTSEYLATTHIHDNRRQSDDHLVPFQGSINWASTIMAFEKIGYDGVLMYEVRNAESPSTVLEKAGAARRRLQDLMIDTTQLSAFTDSE